MEGDFNIILTGGEISSLSVLSPAVKAFLTLTAYNASKFKSNYATWVSESACYYKLYL